jgi:transposase
VEIVYERVAGIDVGKKIVAVAVRTPGERPGKRRQQVRKYNTFYQTLTEMVAWLVAEGVTHVTMEATGIYWRPVFHALCAAEAPLEVLLVNARHVKNVPGRKSDLLTELPDRSLERSARRCAVLARFHPRDQRRGRAAGVVRVGGAAARLAGGDGRPVRAVPAR